MEYGGAKADIVGATGAATGATASVTGASAEFTGFSTGVKLWSAELDLKAKWEERKLRAALSDPEKLRLDLNDAASNITRIRRT